MKNIFLILFAIMGLSLTAHSQSCCSAKSKEKACCAKKAETTEKASTTNASTVSLVASVEDNELTTEKFTVYGNCGMCERTIEGALNEVEGIRKGDWDRATDVMTVVFDPIVISLDDVKQKIADVGYDSDTHRAKDEIYNNLPGCCQYERPENK